MKKYYHSLQLVLFSLFFLMTSLMASAAGDTNSENALNPSPDHSTDHSEEMNVHITMPRVNRYGGEVMVNMGVMSLAALPRITKGAPAPKEVIVVVPKGVSPEVLSQFKQQVSMALSQAQMPTEGISIRIRESYIDIAADQKALLEQKLAFEELARQQRTNVDSEVGGKTADQKLMDKLLVQAQKSLDAGIADNNHFLRQWGLRAQTFVSRAVVAPVVNVVLKPVRVINDTHPYNTIIAARFVAMVKLGVSSGVIVTKYGLNPASFMIGALSGSVAAMFGYNAKKWSQFCVSHQIPVLQEFAPVKFYNERGWLKSANINFWRSLGLSYVYRMLAYLSGQQVSGRPVDSPNSLEFLLGGLGLTIPEIVLDGLMDDGARGLELKGHFNHQSRSYSLWAVGLIDTLMHAFFRAGQTKAAFAVAAVSWGSKLSIWGLSKLADAVPSRWILVSNRISDKANGELRENKNSFFAYLANLGRSMWQGLVNRRQGTFSVSDREMVDQTMGVGESLNLALSAEQDARLRSDKSLTKAELGKFLNLKDTDADLLDDLWQLREKHFQNLGSQSENEPSAQWDPWTHCEQVLRKK